MALYIHFVIFSSLKSEELLTGTSKLNQSSLFVGKKKQICLIFVTISSMGSIPLV